MNIFISEIHYDNDGTDTGESIEITAPAGTDLTDYSIVLYNGSDGTVYNTFNFNIFGTVIIADQGGTGYGTISLGLPSNGLQNGSPDGIALVDGNGDVVEFISYEGVLTASGGPADGQMSTDIGVAQPSNTPEGESLQKTFTIDSNGDAINQAWQMNATSNFGTLNCFCVGTLITSGNDDVVPIESLQINDRVRLHNGQVATVKWVGKQTVTAANDPAGQRNPILIKEGALGQGLPARDLQVSPNHAIYVDGLLINAGALVNGDTIIQTNPTEEFTYYHIELDTHELLLAEGVPAESYLPQQERRDDYDNAAEFDAIYPHGRKVMLWPLPHPRISSAAQVPAYIREKLAPKKSKVA
ncbi:MAG: Hint domain-containing protein [Bacteroidota bacterium]